MIKVSRRAAAAAAAVLALGAGSATWATTSASAATAKPAAQPSFIQRCTANQLAVWVNADSANGAAGTIFYHLDLTNTSGRTCYLFGWPGVSATNSFGHRLGAPARRSPNVPLRIVNVRPGETAHAVLGYVDVQVSPGCHPTTATALKVIPPNTTGSRSAFFPLPVCTNNTVDLTIGRVQAGA
jgi:Protein of unknown function (DUF4232)